MAVKLVADRETGRLLGAEIVGGAGVDKRLDVLATAIYARLTVEDLEQLDLTYAPPYSSAKDPVVIGGHGRRQPVPQGVRLPDPVRTAGASWPAAARRNWWTCGRPASTRPATSRGPSISPSTNCGRGCGELDPALPTVVYCGIGYRSYHAAKILAARGFQDVQNLSGGMSTWQWVGDLTPAPSRNGKGSQ